MSRTLRVISKAELAQHRTAESSWLAIDGVVYDVTKFAAMHPGGAAVLLQFAGRECTEEFFEFHRKEVLSKLGPKLRVGLLEGVAAVPDYDAADNQFDTFTPHAEHPVLCGFSSPYYKPKHLEFWGKLRKFVMEYVRPEGIRCEQQNDDPSNEFFRTVGAHGFLPLYIGKPAMPFIKKFGLPLFGVSADDFDEFHVSIAIYEIAHIGLQGFEDGVYAGLNIGLPPVIHFGSAELKNRIVPEVLIGRKRIGLCVSEAQAGSDVAGIVSTARRTPDGKYFVVNGLKKWITSGYPADLFVTAVRTGAKGHGGLSFLLVEKGLEINKNGTDVYTKRIKTTISAAAGTSHVYYENTLVPVENLLGRENEGFKLVMANFNHERWYIAQATVSLIRLAVADCYRWAIQRRVFGKRLIDQPVIRNHLAKISAGCESLTCQMDLITHQLNTMSYEKQTHVLAAPIALAKYYATRQLEMVSDLACQILGGRGITPSGFGSNVEASYRGRKFAAILGGSEEVLADLAVRQSVGQYDMMVRKNKKALIVSRL